VVVTFYRSLDRFIDDTESWGQYHEFLFDWPFRGAIILYRKPYKGIAVYHSEEDIINSYRFLWVELEIVKGGQYKQNKVEFGHSWD